VENRISSESACALGGSVSPPEEESKVLLTHGQTTPNIKEIMSARAVLNRGIEHRIDEGSNLISKCNELRSSDKTHMRHEICALAV
jgi:hypothetical protein